MRDIAAAEASGDIQAVLRAMFAATSMTTEDYVRNTIGSAVMLYYVYLDKFRQRPRDLEDIIDALLYLDAKAYITKQHMQEEMQSRRQ